MSHEKQEKSTSTGNPTLITLLGKDQAQSGNRFIFGGPVQECRECHLKNICFNLKKGCRYVVSNVRDKEHPCSVFEGGVRVVEVEQVPFRAGVPKSMVVEGSVITFHRQGCGVWGCENLLLSNPVDLADGSRIKVVTILSEKTCADGSSFLEALVDLAD